MKKINKINKVSVPKLLGAVVLIVIVGVGLLSFWPSAEKKLFLSRLETAMEQGEQTIRMDALISEDFDTMCVVEGYDLEFDQKMKDMKQFKRFVSAAAFAKTNKRADDRYMIYLLKDREFKKWFLIGHHVSFPEARYALELNPPNACFAVSQYWLNRHSARNVEVLTLSKHRIGD